MREGGRDKEADCMWLKQRVENLRYLLRRELPGSYLPVLRRGGKKKKGVGEENCGTEENVEEEKKSPRRVEGQRDRWRQKNIR